MGLSTAQVGQLYQKYLGRAPYASETAQVSNWASLGAAAAEAGIAGSDEAKSRTPLATASVPAAASGNALDPYIEKATSIIAPQYNEATNVAQTAADTTKSTYDTMASQQLAREPLVRQTYANLAAEFAASQNRETNVAARIGEQNIGGARASVAATGVENAQGAFQAPITAQQDKLMSDIGNIADKYNLKQETLTSEMNSSLQDLYDKADQYKLTGQSEYSKAMMDIANIKIQQQKDALSLAQEMYSNDMEMKKWEQQIADNERNYQLELRKYNESVREFGISQANSKANASATAAAAAAKDYKYTEQKDAAGNVTGLNFVDDRGMPTAPLEYFQAKGAGTINVDDMKRVFASSVNGGDQDIAASIGIMQRNGLSNAAIGNAIISKYPYLKG